jgi:hypothetical protein
MSNQVFKFRVNRNHYDAKQVPHYNQVTEHSFYIRACDLPAGLPSDCNPRQQNIEKGIYRKITASFCDKEDLSFLLKNNGITILADNVSEDKSLPFGDRVLAITIPDDLGVVNGKHSYNIIRKFAEQNPDQYVRVIVLEGLDEDLIPRIAEGLNTSMQISALSIANFRSEFDTIHKILADKPYYNFLKFEDNDDETTIDGKALLNHMWVCCPAFYVGNSKKHASGIYNTRNVIHDTGFLAEDSNPVKTELLRMVPLLPDIIEISMHLLYNTADLYTNLKAPRKANIYNENSLFDDKLKAPFLDPKNTKKLRQLRLAYVYMILAGLRYCITYDAAKDCYAWTMSSAQLVEIVNAAIRPCLSLVVSRFTEFGGNQNSTQRDVHTWNLLLMKMETIVAQSGHRTLNVLPEKKRKPRKPRKPPFRRNMTTVEISA